MKPAAIGTHPPHMRFRISLCVPSLCIVGLAGAAFAGDNGVPPRRNASEYPAHQTGKAGASLAAIGATIVPPDQVRKLFSSEISRDFIVVEVAMYPADGGSFEADRFDFGLKMGDRVAHAESAGGVAMPDANRGPDMRGPDPKINVEHEVGVVYSRTNDPYYGKRSGVGVYEGTTVSNAPPLRSAPTPSSADPRAMEEKLRSKALPEGPTARPVAGYLYFPAKKRKGDAIELQYTKGDVELDLKFPK
jgi:hypothetical protein